MHNSYESFHLSPATYKVTKMQEICYAVRTFRNPTHFLYSFAASFLILSHFIPHSHSSIIIRFISVYLRHCSGLL